MPGGDVLQAPEAVAGAAGERMNRNVEPAADVARLADRQRGDGVPAGGDMAEQALKLFLRAAAAFEPFGDRREGRGRRPREERMEGGVGVGDRLVGREDELGVGRRLQRLAEEVEAAEQRGLRAMRGERGDAAERRQDDEQQKAAIQPRRRTRTCSSARASILARARSAGSAAIAVIPVLVVAKR
jgi:hypothetical protein